MKPFIIFALLFFSFAVNPVLANETLFRDTLNQFINKALAENPELHEAGRQIEVLKQIPPQVSAFDDPVLQFDLLNLPTDTFAFNQEPMTQKRVTLSQKLPFPGKLSLRSNMAERDVDISQFTYDDLQLAITRQVKQSYFELCYVLAAIEISNQNKSLLEQFITITETKYSVGKGIQQDVIKAQVELSKLLNDLIDLNKRKETEEARLNTLMNLPPDAPLSIAHGIKKTIFDYEMKDLFKIAEERRPVFKKLRSLQEKYRASRNLAEKEYYPDFRVGLSYGQRENNPLQDRADFASAFVSINIPIWYKSKQERKVAEESYRVDVVGDAYHKARNQTFLRIKELLDKEKKGAETLKLIQKGILPQARQSLESALAGYSVDKVDFLTLLNNQVTLFDWELKYHRELTDYEKNLAELEQVAGRALFD
jgi:outer membrane protein TolC